MVNVVEDSSCMSGSSPTNVTIVDQIRATALSQPEHPAVIQSGPDGSDQTVTYAELMHQVDAARAALVEQGWQPYDRCGVKGGNSIRFIVQALAVMDAHYCLVPIAEDYDAAALATFVARCKLHGMIDCATESSTAPASVTSFPAPGAVDEQDDQAFRGLQPAFIRFTSGTTNQRKGVVIGRQSVMERVQAANRGLTIGPDDRILWMLPMAHHFVVSILLYLRYGATILLPNGTQADAVIRLAEQAEATIIYASPDHYQHLLDAGSGNLLPTVRLALSTSMGLSEALVHDFASRFQVHLTQALGIIEVGLPVVNLKHAVTKPLSLGQVQPDYTVKLKTNGEDELSRLGSDSGVGEVCISGPGLFDAYLSPWIPASDVIAAEGFRTGDLGYFDEDRDLYLLGRRQNRINIGGRKFFCEEVEGVLNTYPGIRESRVRSEKVDGAAQVVADIVPVTGQRGQADAAGELDVDELQAFCQAKLNRYKVPVLFLSVNELEKTPTGKIRRW